MEESEQGENQPIPDLLKQKLSPKSTKLKKGPWKGVGREQQSWCLGGGTCPLKDVRRPRTQYPFQKCRLSVVLLQIAGPVVPAPGGRVPGWQHGYRAFLW